MCEHVLKIFCNEQIDLTEDHLEVDQKGEAA